MLTIKSKLKYLLTCYHSNIKLISLILEFGTHKKPITLENSLKLDFFFHPFTGILNTTIGEGEVPIPSYLESNNFRSKTFKITSDTFVQE